MTDSNGLVAAKIMRKGSELKVKSIWLNIWHASMLVLLLDILIGQVAADWPIEISGCQGTTLARQGHNKMILTQVLKIRFPYVESIKDPLNCDVHQVNIQCIGVVYS